MSIFDASSSPWYCTPGFQGTTALTTRRQSVGQDTLNERC
jgi:hypothetical protein